MAQNTYQQNARSLRPRNGGQRARGGAVARRAAAAAPEYFAPERQWIAQRGPQLAALAQQVKMVTALVNAEKQFFDITNGSATPSVTTGNPQYLNGMAEGDDTQGRSGRSIRAKELLLNAHFYMPGSATTSNTVRVIIVKDNSPTGAAPLLSQLMNVAGVDGFPVLDRFQGRFKWLVDERFTIGLASGGADAKIISIALKLDHHIAYVGTTAGVADAGSGALFAYFISDVVTPAVTGSYCSRLRYYDN